MPTQILYGGKDVSGGWENVDAMVFSARVALLKSERSQLTFHRSSLGYCPRMVVSQRETRTPGSQTPTNPRQFRALV